jgi:hypothetical protein
MAQGGGAAGVTFLDCARCHRPISAIATHCPQCGFAVAAPGRRSKRKVRPAVVIGALVLGIGAYVFIARPTRDDLNRLASSAGFHAVPWTDRAQTQANDIYAQIGSSLATTMVNIIHPSGQNATLVSHATTAEGGGIIVSHFELAWKSGQTGQKNTTLVEWRCSEEGYTSAAVGADSATTPVSQRSIVLLDEYLRTNIFPLVKKNAN